MSRGVGTGLKNEKGGEEGEKEQTVMGEKRGSKKGRENKQKGKGGGGVESQGGRSSHILCLFVFMSLSSTLGFSPSAVAPIFIIRGYVPPLTRGSESNFAGRITNSQEVKYGGSL